MHDIISAENSLLFLFLFSYILSTSYLLLDTRYFTPTSRAYIVPLLVH
jgi:hypothetical protein